VIRIGETGRDSSAGARICSRLAQNDSLQICVFLKLQAFQVFAEGDAEVVALQGELDGGFQETQFVSGIVAAAFVDVGVHFFFLQEVAHAVGELKFATGASLCFGEALKDGGSENVAADDGQIRRGFFRFWFLDHVFNFEEAITEAAVFNRLYVEDAVRGNHFAFDDLSGEDGALLLIEDFDHLLEAGNFGVDHVVGQENGEGLVADKLAGHQDGVAEAESFFLADIGDMNHVGDGADDVKQVGFVALLEHGLEFIADVEVVFDGLFATAGDDEDLVATGGHGLLDSVLDDGLVDQREHFFGLSFGSG
jgi:hypothetical protein